MNVVDGGFKKQTLSAKEMLEEVSKFIEETGDEEAQISVVVSSQGFLSVLSNYKNIAEAHFDLCIICDNLLAGVGGGNEQYH